jgi:hypothetical protein
MIVIFKSVAEELINNKIDVEGAKTKIEKGIE